MKNLILVKMCLFMLATLTSCGVTKLKPEAKLVKIISEKKIKQCRLIDVINTRNFNHFNKDGEEVARNKALNKASDLGGNALRIINIKTDSVDVVGTIYHITSEVYLCKNSL